MTRLGRRKAWLVGSAYTYWALFVASWWLWLNSNHNESWFDAFESLAEIAFLPLLLVTFGICRLAWGSVNIFDAHVVGGLLVDVAFTSLLTVSFFAILVLRWKTAEPTRHEVRLRGSPPRKSVRLRAVQQRDEADKQRMARRASLAAYLGVRRTRRAIA